PWWSGEWTRADSSVVFWLDRRADVDGGQGGEDERLDADHDHDLEQIEEDRRDHDRDECERLEDEDQPEEREDQDVAREHVREEPHAEGDQPHELAEDLERHDEDEQPLWSLRNPALEVALRAVPPDGPVVREAQRE